ncbi:MAG: hypothetical protein KKC46_08840 [Proteobacteria bacterium]|nr:hypothetical protein [Pseudomonadota bacterium]
MRSKRRIRRKGLLYVFAITAILGLFTPEIRAGVGSTVTTFHGYLESSYVLRDTTGIQNGFFEEAEGVQQRNTLKFDLDIDPGSNLEWGSFRVLKAHMTFRGAYDSIYDLRGNEYHDIRENMGLSRFDYGKKDVKFENDLREAFIDFRYSGALGNFFFRPGRQIVSWGEAGGNSTLLDVINPKDQSNMMFFQNPDDVKIPLWMARLNYSLPVMRGLGVNFDFLWVPDIRPAQFGPLDSVAGDPSVGLKAPYVSILFGGFKGYNVEQRVPTEEQEYGAKVTVDIKDNLSISATYFRDVNNDGGTVLVPATSTFLLTHNIQHVYGAYFSYNILPLDLIIRGEIARHTGDPISRYGAEPSNKVPGGLALFRLKPTTRWMLALDKKYMLPFLTTHERSNLGFEWIHEKINEWDSVFNKPESQKAGSKQRDLDIISFFVSWSLLEGRIAPTFAAAWIPSRPGAGGESGYIHPVVSWQISNDFYSSIGLHAFLGDKTAKTGFAGLVTTSELTLKLGYNW